MIPIPPRKIVVPTLIGGQRKNLVVHDWGDAQNPNVLVCVHGLSRNGRDFDVIANALADYYRVLCPDVFGRGESDWLDRAENYVVPP